MSIDASYRILVRWGSRPEVPAELADRFLKTIDALDPLHPLFAHWIWSDREEFFDGEGDDGKYALAEIRHDLVHAMSRNMAPPRMGRPIPMMAMASWRSRKTRPIREAKSAFAAAPAAVPTKVASQLYHG